MRICLPSAKPSTLWRTAASAAVLSLPLLAAAPAAAVTTRIVDCESGPFQTIQAAITAAEAGDTVVVHQCPLGPYAPFSVTKDRLHVVAADLDIDLTGAVAQGVGVLPSGFVPPVVVDGGLLEGTMPCASIAGTEGVTIEGFYLQNCLASGIEIGPGAADTELTSNRVESPADAGVLITSATETTITGNLIALAGLSGIVVDSASSGTIITDNLIGANDGRGILNEGTGSRIVNNSVRGNTQEGICENGLAAQIALNTALNNGSSSPAGSDIGLLVNGDSTDAALTGNNAGLGSILDPFAQAECAENDPPCDQSVGTETCSSSP